ncbi:hypothetical protein G7Y79_00046g082200 [Physcia stellaris]|nr:hypothetical protein G7Y79_00046g082200 [Physcia stellaris]
MENESLKPIYVPDNIVLNIELALHRKGRAKITDKTCLELIAQIVDWWEASLTDKELETALFMLGDRQKLSKPPGKESFSIVAAPKHGRPDWPHIKMNEQVLNDTPLPLKRYYTLVPPDKGSLSSRILKPWIEPDWRISPPKIVSPVSQTCLDIFGQDMDDLFNEDIEDVIFSIDDGENETFWL